MSVTTTVLIKSDWLNIDASVTTHDALLGRLLLQAESIVNDICNQPVIQETKVHLFSGDGSSHRILPYINVPVTLTTLKYRTLPTDTYASLTGGAVYKRDGLWHIYHSEAFAYSMYELTVAVGYVEADAPKSLINIVSEMVKELYLNTGDQKLDRFGVSSVAKSEGGTTTTTSYKNLRDSFKEKLAPYIVRAWI